MSHADMRSTIIARMAASTAPGAVVPRLVSEYSDFPGFYPALISVLCDLELPEEQARGFWNRCSAHQAELQAQLGRKLDIRVAIMDVMTNSSDLGMNPRIGDIVRDEQRRRDAFYDEVTGLHNRRYIIGCIERELSRSLRHELVFSVVFIDMDDFKGVNDEFGHATGDEVLRAFASHLRHCLRVEDVAARFGGDEFVVLLPQTATSGAELFRQRLESALAAASDRFAVSMAFSAGLATYPVDALTSPDLLEVADDRLFEAKSRKNRDRGSARGAEKRRYDRYAARLPVEIDLGEGAPVKAAVIDLSAGGVSIETDQAFTVGRKMRIVIHSPGTGKTYQITSQIVWTQELTEDGAYRIGAQYRQHADESMHDLVEALRHASSA